MTILLNALVKLCLIFMAETLMGSQYLLKTFFALKKRTINKYNKHFLLFFFPGDFPPR